MLIDSHCHINFKVYKKDADDVIQRSLSGDTWLINVGAQFSTSKRAIVIAEKYEKGVYAAVGLHPIHLLDDITESAVIAGQKYTITTKKEEFDYEKYKTLALSSKKIVALGETGLDYYNTKSQGPISNKDKILQKQVFEKFIDLSQEINLPLIVHCRGDEDDYYGVYDEMLEIFSARQQKRKINGVIHCFGGNLQQAQQFVQLGFYIGFTGIITFKRKAEELQEIVKKLPLDKILIETDAPFLAPEPYRGKRNEPVYVKFVAEKIAELKNISPQEVIDITTKNAIKLFNL